MKTMMKRYRDADSLGRREGMMMVRKWRGTRRGIEVEMHREGNMERDAGYDEEEERRRGRGDVERQLLDLPTIPRVHDE
jgi:hypothetical protein